MESVVPPPADFSPLQATLDDPFAWALPEQIPQNHLDTLLFDFWLPSLPSGLPLSPQVHHMDTLTSPSPFLLDSLSSDPLLHLLPASTEASLSPPGLTAAPTPVSSPSDSEEISPPPSPKPRHARQRGGRSRSRAYSNSTGTSRLPHKVIEQKYRQSLNTAIQSLKDVLLGKLDDEVALCAQPTKAGILVEARKYIIQLKRDRDRLQTEVMALRERERRLGVGF